MKYLIGALWLVAGTVTLLMIVGLLWGCATPTLNSVGPQWQLKATCEMKATSNDYYATTKPENKCGGVLEVIIVKGGH